MQEMKDESELIYYTEMNITLYINSRFDNWFMCIIKIENDDFLL